VLSFISTPCHEPGSSLSEAHIKQEIWRPIFSNAFKIKQNGIQPVWDGSARSDFSAIVTNQKRVAFPIFIAEFEQNGFENHKDYAIVAAEGSFELTRILHFTKDDESLLNIKLHVALINGTHIAFSVLRPTYNPQLTRIVYSYEQNVKTFNLQNNDQAQDVGFNCLYSTSRLCRWVVHSKVASTTTCSRPRVDAMPPSAPRQS